MIGTTTVFKNDAYFGGDVVLTTEDFNSGFVGVTVVVIPNSPQPSDGGFHWDLSIAKGDLTDNKQVLEEVKKERYWGQGYSETIEIIEEESEMEDAKVTELREFRKHMYETSEELLDELDEGKDYDNKFDLRLELNGKRIDLEMCADLYNRLVTFIDDTIKEEEQ